MANKEWTIVDRSGSDNDTLKGFTVESEITRISTRDVTDVDRWEKMPSLSQFSASLKVLDLHNSRYITELDSSVCDLKCLEVLILTQCDRLNSLPENIGDLQNLVEVSASRTGDSHLCSCCAQNELLLLPTSSQSLI